MSPSRTLEGLFEQTQWVHFKGPQLASCVASRTTKNKGQHQVFPMLGAEVPGQRQEQLTQTLIVHWLKTHLILLFWKLEGPGPTLSPLATPLIVPHMWGLNTSLAWFGIVIQIFTQKTLLTSIKACLQWPNAILADPLFRLVANAKHHSTSPIFWRLKKIKKYELLTDKTAGRYGNNTAVTFWS